MRLIAAATLLVSVWQILPDGANAETPDPGRLFLPGSGTEVDLYSGTVTRKGISAQCLESVSRTGSNTLVVAKTPGDDAPDVRVNGVLQDLTLGTGDGIARIGAIRLSRDGSLFHLRTFKTGDKQTELVEDGTPRLTFARGTAAKLLSVSKDDLTFQVHRSGESARLVRFSRSDDGSVSDTPETLLDFGTCLPHRLRLKGDTAWARMTCEPARGSGIFRVDLANGTIGAPVLPELGAQFVSLPRGSGPEGAETFLTVDGTPAALHFFNAASGLLAAQTGEVRACSSDAEGLQSWNQSYRAMALASLFAKTREPVFANLARKSISLTLAAQDGKNGRETAQNPACGWSSRIYSANPDSRMSLMINQGMIANGLKRSCDALGMDCPPALKSEIDTTRMCLADFFEPHFDDDVGLYRIQPDIAFRFAGVVAPWNWQMAFATLLSDLPNETLAQRGQAIAARFVSEWSQDGNGALWRYWPLAYYHDRGLSPDQIGKERFEDTGHAGISLMSLSDFPMALDGKQKDQIGKRLDYLLAEGLETPRDLDGRGPRSTRWFPSGGWAGFASQQFKDTFADPVPGAKSADTLLAYASLFDPGERFELTLTLHACTQTCSVFERRRYSSIRAYLRGNPQFVLAQHSATANRK